MATKKKMTKKTAETKFELRAPLILVKFRRRVPATQCLCAPRPQRRSVVAEVAILVLGSVPALALACAAL